MKNINKSPLTRSQNQNVAKERKNFLNLGEYMRKSRRKIDFENQEKSMPFNKPTNVIVKNLTAQCKCVKNEERLGFYRVKIPVDTSLNDIVKKYALPFAKELQHDDVYISTKLYCK